MHRLRLVLSLLLLVMLAPAASANGLPIGAWLGTTGGLLLPTENPNVLVRSEELRFIISSEAAVVSALYRLENQGGPTAGEVAFAVPSGSTNLLVTVGGKTITVPQLLMEGEKLGIESAGQLTLRPAEWRNPLTGAPYAAKLWRQEPGVYWQRFAVELPPGPQELMVTYRSGAGEDNSRLLRPIKRFDYLLRPASRWAAFGELRILVETTESHSLASNIPLKRIDERHLEASFTELPSENLALFIGPPGSGPVGALWWSKAGRFWLMTGASLLLGLGAGLMRRLHWALRLPVALLPLLLLDRGIFEPNPIGNVAHLLNFGFQPLLYLVAWRVGAKLAGRRRTA